MRTIQKQIRFSYTPVLCMNELFAAVILKAEWHAMTMSKLLLGDIKADKTHSQKLAYPYIKMELTNTTLNEMGV